MRMGPVSDRSSRTTADNRPCSGVKVHDSFETKAEYGPGLTPGLVVVLAGYPDRRPRRHVGKVATVIRPDGSSLRAAVAEEKDHGPTISLFFADSTGLQVWGF